MSDCLSRDIARLTGLSRDTILKYLREGEAAPSSAKRTSPRKVDAFAEKLCSWLKSATYKSRKQPTDHAQAEAYRGSCAKSSSVQSTSPYIT